MGTLRFCIEQANGDPPPLNVSVAANSWTEASLAWNNKPALGTQVGTVVRTVGCKTIQVPVVEGENTYAITRPTAETTRITSDESTITDHGPTLTV